MAMDKSTRNGVSAIAEYDYTAKEPDELDLIKGAIINNIKQQPGGWWEGVLASTGKTGMFPDNFVRLLDNHDDSSTVVMRDKSATVHRRCKVIYSYSQVNDDELSLAVGDVIEFLGEVEEGWWRGKLKEKIGVFPSNFVLAIESTPILASKRPYLPTVTTTVPTTTQVTSSSTLLSSSSLSLNHNIKTNRSSIHSSKEDLLNSSSTSSILQLDRDRDNIKIDKDAPVLPPKPIKEYCRVEFAYKPQNEDELELNTGDIITIVTKDLADNGWWKGEHRGKIGVFPDNFVKLLPPDFNVTSPSNESERSTSTTGGTTKIFIKKSGSTSSTQSSNRKDSFGSRDSLNDILNETGLPTGNVAAQRKSLENKNFDLSNIGPSGDGNRTRRSIESKTSESRKSMENIDEKKTLPPVVSKKPSVPVKKTTGVTSVAGNILLGIKQKVKGVSMSQDSADGIGSSKQMGDIERPKKDDLEFDSVERASLLTDMRAGRVKAPKRRPPSAAVNVIGESNNNNSIYLNGGGSYIEELNHESQQRTLSGNSGGDTNEMENELAKPKPREWATKRAPWMAELKASQEKKKTSPNIEPRSIISADRPIKTETVAKILPANITTNSATVSQSASVGSNIITTTTTTTNNVTARKPIEPVSMVTKPPSTVSYEKKEQHITDMTKSMSTITTSTATTTKILTNDTTATTLKEEDPKMRPSSLRIHNRSISPINQTAMPKPINTDIKANTTITPSAANSVTPFSTTTNCVSEKNNINDSTTAVDDNNSSSYLKVDLLEKRVCKLEVIVQSQQMIIDELVRALREETDKVKGLKTELDKYAQCVTQV